MAFKDEKPTLNSDCPLKANLNCNCRKKAVEKALVGVRFSPQVYYIEFPSVMREVCEFCKKEHVR